MRPYNNLTSNSFSLVAGESVLVSFSCHAFVTNNTSIAVLGVGQNITNNYLISSRIYNSGGTFFLVGNSEASGFNYFQATQSIFGTGSATWFDHNVTRPALIMGHVAI